MKLLLIDTETTGLIPGQHCVVQVAVRITANPGEVKSFSFLLKPRKGAQVADEALKVQGITREDLQSDERYSYTDGFHRFQSLLKQFVDPFNKRDKFHVFAYNQDFDQRFLRQFWADHDDNCFDSWFWSPWHCVWGMAGLRIIDQRPSLKSTKLCDMAKFLDIDTAPCKLHDAAGDVALTAQVLYRLDPRFDFRLPEERGTT